MTRLIFALGLALTALTPMAAAADDAAKTSVDDRCLFASRVDGFQEAKRDSVVLTAGQRRWKADFATNCSGLDFAITIGVDSKTTCVTAGDSVVFKETGGFAKRCMISEITFLPKEEKKDEKAAE